MIFKDWELGTIVQGVNTASTTRIRTSGYHVPTGSKLILMPTTGYKVAWCGFNSACVYQAQAPVWITERTEIIVEYQYYRFSIARVDSADMNISESINVNIYCEYAKDVDEYYLFYANITPSRLRFSGHRGCMDIAPENSLPSFKLAGEHGAWGIETDPRMTSDGYLICMHDTTVDRTTNGMGRVSDLTLSQIRAMAIDAGSNANNYSGSDLLVPTFEEYLKICKRYGCVALVHIQADETTTSINNTLDIVMKHGMESSCVFQSWVLWQMEYVRSLNPKVHVMVASPTVDKSFINAVMQLKNCGVHIGSYDGITEELIKYLHEHNMTIFTGGETAQERDAWRELGVDAITTSYLITVVD